MANCDRQNLLPENTRFELFYGDQKATTARSCVCVKHSFRFRKRTFWRENVPDLECNFSHGNTSHVLSHTSHHVVTVQHSSHQSLKSLY